MKIKKLVIIAALMVLALAVMGCGGNGNGGGGDDTIQFVLINSVTGDKALPGAYTTSGAKMAVDEINEAGGVLGKQIELLIEDDAGTTSGAVNAFQKVASQYKPAVVFGPIYSNMDLAMESYMMDAKIPVIAGATNVKLTHHNNPWYFRIRANDGAATRLAVQFVIENFQAQSIGILHDSDEFGTGGAAMVEAAAQEFGVEVKEILAYHGGDRDFSSQLTAFERAGVDVIISWGHSIEAGLFYRQHSAMGLEMPIVGSPSWGTPVAIDVSEGTANGHYSIIDYSNADDDPVVVEFDENFQELFGMESDFYAASYYDGVYIAAKAIEIADSTDPDAIRDALLSIRDFEGVIGKYSFTGRGDGIHQYRFVQIEDDKAKVHSVVSGDPWVPSEVEREMFELLPEDQLPPLWID